METDLDEDLVAFAEYDRETEFNGFDLDAFASVLLNDNRRFRAEYRHTIVCLFTASLRCLFESVN